MDIKEYYSRSDVQKEFVRLSKNREVQAWFGIGVAGRRPEIVNFEGDVKDLTKQGMTSFHISEERWRDPLLLEAGLPKKQLDEHRIGWDVLLDLDSKNLEFSKYTAELIIDALKFHDVKNYSLKFSVTGDTPVLIRHNGETKLMPISEAVTLQKSGKKLKVLSLNRNNRLIFSDVIGSLKHEDYVYNIFYEQSGLPLKATGYHSVFCWSNGKIYEKKVSELKIGDYLVSFISSKDSNYSLRTVMNKFTYYSENKYISLAITPKLCRLIGYYLSEGHIAKINYMVGFSFNKNEKIYINDCKDLISSLPNFDSVISDHYPNSGSHQVIFHSKDWFKFFNNFCGTKKNKHVPDFVWDLPKELFLEIFLGYARGDAHKKSSRYLTIKSVSHRLATEFLWLCKLHNLSCNIYEEYSKPHKMPQGNIFIGSHVYMIKVLRADIEIDEFNTKRNKSSQYPSCRVFPIDGLKQVYKKIKPGKFLKHRLEDVTLRKKRANLNRIAKVIEWFENYNTLLIDAESLEIINDYKSIVRGDICVLPVRRIDKIKNKTVVYDLSVKDSERFFWGCYPVLLHNSGNHGWHIAIPFEAFPREVNGVDIKNYFPEGVKVISEYLKDMIREFLTAKVLSKYKIEDAAKSAGKKVEDVLVKSKFDVYKLVDIDSVLISSRHLFRCAYSINEKSGFVSIPVNNIKDFNIEDAKMENVKVKLKFLDLENVVPGEARKLMLEAFDWNKKVNVVEEKVFKVFEVPKAAIKADYFPPCILKLMSGLKEDGRKRGVFVLVNFLLNVGWSFESIDDFLLKWNKNNYEPLREGYLRAQLSWFKRKEKKVLPPNCNNASYYSSMGIKCSDNICAKCKNPVNYAVRMSRMKDKPSK